MKDYLSAIDDISKEPYVDTNRLGCVGASFGGFSVYWLAGHHDKRFKAFIAHDGIFNMEQQYLETEEMWFANWDMGGAYWDKNNATAQRTFANSPHRCVAITLHFAVSRPNDSHPDIIKVRPEHRATQPH